MIVVQWVFSPPLEGNASVENPDTTAIADPMAVDEDTTVLTEVARAALTASPDNMDIEKDFTAQEQVASIPSTLPSPASSPSPVKRGKMPVYKMNKNSPEALRPLILQAFQHKRFQNLNGIRTFIEQEFDGYQNNSAVWMDTVNDILHQYDFPLIPKPSGNRMWFVLMRGIEPGSLPFDPTPNHTGPSDLMRLDRRLRLKVFRYVLHLPTPHGWQIDDHYTMNSRTIYNHRKAGESLSLRAPYSNNFTLTSPPLQTWMALLSVSRKIFSETMPLFYLHNTFRFESCITMESFLKKLPTRRRFVARVVLNYDPPLYNSRATPAMKQLCETNLKYLKLEIDELEALAHGNGYGNVSRLPGFSTLRDMRGLDELVFSGNCEKTKKHLGILLKEKDEAARGRGIEDMEAKYEARWEESKVAMRKEMKIAMKEVIKGARRDAVKAKKDAEQSERKAEREKKMKEREEEREKRDKEKRLERSEKEKERERIRRQKQREREAAQKARKEAKERKELENEEKEQKRHNKQQAMLAKQQMKKVVNRLISGKRARDVETDDDEEAGPSTKRVKPTPAVRGGGGGRGRGHGGKTSVGRAGPIRKLKAPAAAKKPVSAAYVSDESDEDGPVDAKGHPQVESESSEAE